MNLQISVTKKMVWILKNCWRGLRVVFIWKYSNWCKMRIKYKKRQHVAKLNRRHYHLQKKRLFNTLISIKKAVGFKKNIRKHGLHLPYNIRIDTLLSIGYIAVRHIPCSCSSYLRKLASPCNISQNKYSQDQYKG